MKLYELPRTEDGFKIYMPEGTTVSDGKEEKSLEYVTFWHIDGAYSLCTTPDGASVHLSASAPLIKYKDGYKLESVKGGK